MSELITDPLALLAAFPYSLQRDDDKAALAEAIAVELVNVLAQTNCASVLPRVDELPEAVLDILAYDFKVEWYELDAPIRNKRQAIKECMLVHKYKGTKYAVETALRSMYNSAEVKEWFEYGGEPFHFTVKVYGSTSDGLKTLYLKIQYAKNLRSVMDMVSFQLVPEQDVETYFGVRTASIRKCLSAALSDGSEDVYTTAESGFTGVSLVSLAKRIKVRLADMGENPPNTIGNYHAAISATGFAKTIGMEVKL